MPWTNWPLSIGDSEVDENIKEIWYAAHERFLALEFTGTPTWYPAPVVDESPLLKRADIVAIQTFIETWCVGFIKPPPLGYDVGDYSGVASLDTWTWADLKADVGMNVAGWLRYYPREIAALTDVVYADGDAVVDGHKARFPGPVGKGLVYERVAGVWTNPQYGIDPTWAEKYGTAEIGDYFTATMLNEIYECLNRLRHTKKSHAWNYAAIPDNEYAGTGTGASDAAARTAATADYGVDGIDATQAPRATALAAESGGTYTVQLNRTFNYGKAVGVIVQMDVTVEWYAKATAPALGAATTTPVWDDNGDDVLQDQYSLWDSTNETPDPIDPTIPVDLASAGTLGGTAQPSFATAPAIATQVNTRGWTLEETGGDAQVVLRWDMEYK